MIDAIPWGAIGSLTPGGLVTVIVWMVLTGRIVPKSTYDVMVKARDDWQATATKKQEIIQTLSETVRDQTAIGEFTAKIMTAVQEANKDGDKS